MVANDVATSASQNRSGVQNGRYALVALWITQAALAAMFFLAGGSKLAGAPAMVGLFGAIGAGQWFRYFTGAVEVSAAVALLIPATAFFGATLLVATMLGAIATRLFIIGGSPAMELVLLAGATGVAWARRHRVQQVFHRSRRN
jgi:hypothetical protein